MNEILTEVIKVAELKSGFLEFVFSPTTFLAKIQLVPQARRSEVRQVKDLD